MADSEKNKRPDTEANDMPDQGPLKALAQLMIFRMRTTLQFSDGTKLTFDEGDKVLKKNDGSLVLLGKNAGKIIRPVS